MESSTSSVEPGQSALEPVSRPLNLIPVGLKEAALDSPTFRATALHFGDQIEVIERWLDGYVKAASHLVAQVGGLEKLVNDFLSQSMPPSHVSEAVLDHDYTLLAMKRYGEGAREFWNSTLRSTKKYDGTVIAPIREFLGTELRGFKEARRSLDSSQKVFDVVLARYLGQSKTKEASSLREDAFQLHEARKAYMKASMDFCVAAPQLRANLDKLIVRIFAEQWKEMRAGRDASAGLFEKWGGEVERVRGWSRELENSERAFKRELVTARRQIEESAMSMTRPSRELEDYAASTVPYLGTGAGAGGKPQLQDKNEKQGWLFLKTTAGKAPARTVWSRRWFFVKDGIFGWLVQGVRSGGVEESEKIGVLLCSVRAAFQEERRFCFEVKTKDTSIVLQSETQAELTEWISAFEMAKRKALQDPASIDGNSTGAPSVDPAFAITPPIAPEFAAKVGDGHGTEDSLGGSLGAHGERDANGMPPASRSSFDVSTIPSARRVMSLEKAEGEGSREHAARIIQKLDLHKRSTASPQVISQTTLPGAAGGIASLISASHNILPVGPGAPPPQSPAAPDVSGRRSFTTPANYSFTMPTSTLAPSTLAAPPAPTNLSHTAVVISGERGLALGRGADGSGMPSGIMANLWGSSNWGYVNRLNEDPRPESKRSPARTTRSVSGSHDDSEIMETAKNPPKPLMPLSAELSGLGPHHRKTVSDASESLAVAAKVLIDDDEAFPNYYPLPLKAQQAQFRMLFPSVPRSEKVVLVFRATWNPNEQQEFPGRVYVTSKDVYFYSNHLGLVLITGISLASIDEVTAAPGRNCDFVYLHLKEGRREEDQRRVTVKVFLEPLKLLQRRLNWLAHNANADAPASLEEVLKALIKMEAESPQRSSSVESWEHVAFDRSANGESSPPGSGARQYRRERDVQASLRIDGSLYGDPARTGRELQKFRLPNQPVIYAPQGMQASVTRDYNVSAKALFHVIFGDKSAVFQLLYLDRWADNIAQTPWVKPTTGNWTRQFSSQGRATPLADTQTIEIFNDHLCYVITNTKTPWRLPYSSRFAPTTKYVITHAAKSRCRLAIFQQIRWERVPRWPYIRRLIEQQALHSLEADALDLSNVAMDQVAKLGNHSKTNRAIEIFGNVGVQVQVPAIDTKTAANLGGTVAAQRLKQRKPVGLVRLVVDDQLSRALATVGWAIDVTIAIAKGVLGLCSAHTLLVGFLIVSFLYNGWYGYRDSVEWWHERSAAKFMARVGVKPDLVMSKAVYLSDIEDFVAAPALSAGSNSTLAAMIPTEQGLRTCKTTFVERLTTDPSYTGRGSGSEARLHRTRDSLAQYRHDLLVALRVVNRVERDVVAAEWEEWIRAEGKKCAKVEGMLKQQRASKGRQAKAVTSEQADAELGRDFAEYCRSCRGELAGLASGNGTSLI